MPDSLLFGPFKVRDDSNPSGDGLSHLNRIKLGGAATYIKRFMKKKNTIPGVSDAVIMASVRTGVRDPDLLKKLARRQPKTVKDLFGMADQYASQEEAVAAENNDRP